MTKKGHTTAILPKCFTSKEATFILRNGDSRSWWFEIQDPLYSFFIIDYAPENYPSLEVNFGYKCKEDGYKRIKEMYENEGWELIRGKDEFDMWHTEGNGCHCIIDAPHR